MGSERTGPRPADDHQGPDERHGPGDHQGPDDHQRPGDHQAFVDLVAAYALDAAEHEDVPHVRAHLAACCGCRSQLRRHHEVLAVLGATAAASTPVDRLARPAAGVPHGRPPGPSPAVWRRIARRTAGGPPPSVPPPPCGPPHPRRDPRDP